MNGPEPIKGSRMSISVGDLKQSCKFADHILNKGLHDKVKTEHSELVLLAFSTSLIVSYCRPFTSYIEDGRMRKLKPELNHLTVEESTLHVEVLGKRDTIIGHSDPSVYVIPGHESVMMHYPFHDLLKKPQTTMLRVIIKKWIAWFLTNHVPR